MPTLHWATKSTPQPVPADLVLDSMVYPAGVGYPINPAEAATLPPSNGGHSQLILGDNLGVMSALLPEYEGRINLIYADPPFFTNRRYPARVGRGEDSRRPQEWQLAEGYPDYWSDLDAYLDMLYSRLWLMHRLLAANGTLYLHLDWHANSYARLLMDEVFGPDRLLNEIVWIYHGPSPIRTAFKRKHDTIFVYTKSAEYTFNADAVREAYHPNTIRTFASSAKAGFGKVPDLERGKVPEDWWYFPVVARLHSERSGYPTQKPEALLERIVLASSNPGDRIADFFCGSGTAAVVAARLGRRFIANDVSWRAVHTTRCRLVELPSPPFTIQKTRSGDLLDYPTNPTPDLIAYRPISNTLSLTSDLALDYWETDPAWDSHIFRSAAQAVRPRVNHAVARELPLPVSPGSKICTRLVKINGEKEQVILEPSRSLL